MTKKLMAWKPKGMNRDLSVSSFNPEFAFENVNLRLSTNENNTLMSWVTEKGPTSIIPQTTSIPPAGVTIVGITIGTAVINKRLVLFTHSDSEEVEKPDRIYVLEWDSKKLHTMNCRKLYEGNLDFDIDHPLETLVSYEAEHIQKVYWTDNKNQPRMINLEADSRKVEWWNGDGSEFPGVDTFFDFVPAVKLLEEVEITKVNSGGTFSSGVIQYCFTYINKYGQQSNIIYVSPLYYLAHDDRGASPEDIVNNSFTIKVKDLDANFDYLRIYSIQRVATDSVIRAKLLEDIPIKDADVESAPGYADVLSVTYTDNGVMGATIDPTELLFVGGKEIQVFTMADKDGTLFLGNFTQKNTLMNNVQEYFRENPPIITFDNTSSTKKLNFDHATGFYTHTNQLSRNNREITTFKGGEKYRFGFQLQKYTGEWLEPVFIGDADNPLYPNTSMFSDTAYLPYAYATLNFSSITGFDSSIYKKIRPVIVFPNISDRQVLCQGVLNPTVFTINDRKNKYPFAQASWFFRPYYTESKTIPSSVPSAVGTCIYDDQQTSTPSINQDSFVTQSNHYKNYYIIVATFADDANKKAILKRGYLNIIKKRYYPNSQAPRQTTYETVEFAAAHINASNVPPLTYAFFIKKGFGFSVPTPNTPFETEDVITGERLTYEYDSGFKNNTPVYATENYFPVYNGFKETNDHLFYYVKPDEVGAPNTVNIKFYCVYHTTSQGNTYHVYTIPLNALESAPYDNVEQNNNGEYLPFKHYDSLKCQSDEDSHRTPPSGSSDVLPDYRGIEIQGSFKVYANPYSVFTDISEEKSNSQFFIDQSIVTLNSPDIEFDTAIQTYPMENLKLRIIGAIPITGYTSAHNIQTSTPMLPAGLNKHGAGSDPEYFNSVTFGSGELPNNIQHLNIDIYAGKRLVAEKLWQDILIRRYRLDDNPPAETYGNEDSYGGSSVYEAVLRILDTGKFGAVDYFIFPWHRQGSLNNDNRREDKASSWLKAKKMSHLLFSTGTEYLPSKVASSEIRLFTDISTQIHLTENGQIQTLRLPRQTKDSSEINYYPNVEKVLYNKAGYKIACYSNYIDSSIQNQNETKLVVENDEISGDDGKRIRVEDGTSLIAVTPVSMKYKSTSHIVIAMNAITKTVNSEEKEVIPILPNPILNNIAYGDYDCSTGDDNTIPYETKWDDIMQFDQEGIHIDNLFKFGSEHVSHDFLWLGELYKDPVNPFGGTGKTAMRNNNWLIGGEVVDFADQVTLTWTEGDTYYQRYDCLKTYPFTVEDQNQIVEILSFMCETRVNIDGRWDRNRGQADNTNMRPDIFNKINEAYTQQDNFFTSRAMDVDDRDKLEYPNQVYYTKTKTSGADVDLWTNMTLATPLELDGDKGKLNSLQRFNDQIIAFQDSGISQILYNENVQISSTQGVPIEIANSGKVQGKRYFSDTIGCSNKWSIANTPMGIYFMDSIGKSIYLFNGQLTPLSFQGGFNTWTKQNIPSASIQWNPVFSEGHNNFVTYYDKMNQDVLFINNETCLAYSERVGAFTSFYNYEDTPYFCNLDDTGIWVRRNDDAETSVLYHHNEGDYCNFFGNNMPYSMTLVGNAEPSTDKIFTNLEFRANSDGEGTSIGSKFIPYVPFDSLESWNEHQHGIANLAYGTGRYATLHHTRDNNAALNRKFRIWRCDIPRDNAPVDTESENLRGIYRFNTHPLDRMRNPWVYLKLTKGAANPEETLPRTEIHDILMTYFN